MGSTGYATAVARIRDTIAAYAHALDDGRTDDLVATFAPDGVSTFPGTEPLRGHQALRAAYAALVPRGPQRHVVANTCVSEFDGRTALVVSDLVFLVKGDSSWTVRFAGRYTDRMRAEGDTWLFESRELVLD